MAKTMTVAKTVSINKNSNEVFNYLKQTKNQDSFSVWNMKDPKAKKTYKGTDGMKGFVYSWDSTDKSVGAGAQEIMNVEEGNRIDYQLRFIKPMQNIATSSFIIHKTGANNTAVTWTFESPTKFPMSLFAPLFKRILGKQIDQSLQNLKIILDKQ